MAISLVIPVYNGAQTIGSLVSRLLRVLHREDLQIVLVNDGSPDNSHEVCRDLAVTYPKHVVYIQLARNFGEHNAVMAGLNYADGDYVVIMDDDFQNPPEEVPRIVQYAEEHGSDIVYTYYACKRHHVLRNLGSAFTNWIATFLLNKPKDLYLSSFKCLSRLAVREIIKYQGPFPYIDGLALRCTMKIDRLEVAHDKRQIGQSGYTFRKLVRLWLNMFINFSIMPLRVSTFLGFLLSAIGAFMAIYVVFEKLLTPGTPIGWTSLFVAFMVFSGVQLLVLGLVGEYLGRLFLMMNQTPQFVVREVYRAKK